MKDFIIAILFASCVVLATSLFVVGVEAVNCASYEAITGRETKMTLSCYVKDENTWYSRKEFEFKQAGVTSKEN